MRSITTTALLACALTSFAEAQIRAVFLLDRSGSMSTGLPTRCDRSELQAKRDIDNFFASYPGALVSVREFTAVIPTGARWVGASEWNTSATAARAAVDSAITCAGNTPLADAICDSTTALLVAGSSSQCWFYVYSDGGENASSGACAGGSATNALTGRCSFDLTHPGMPYLPAADGTLSWQQRACNSINVLNLTCGLVFNVYKFDHFGTDATDPGFAFLDSCARGSGGISIEIDDALSAPASYVSNPATGCSNAAGLAPTLHTSGSPSLGDTLTVLLDAPATFDRWLIASGTRYTPPVDLSAIAAPGCALGVESQFVVHAPLLPLPIGNNPSFIGTELHFQGVIFDLSRNFLPGWLLTTPTLSTVVFDAPAVAPLVSITQPAVDSGINDAAYVWDGYDAARGQWYKDLCVSASITDNEPVNSGSIVWTTNRSNLQPALLGTGASICRRFYGNSAGGEWHAIRVTVTDREGIVVSRTRNIRFWTLF